MQYSVGRQTSRLFFMPKSRNPARDFIDIQFPHPLLTDVLIYEANVAGSESPADLIHHDTAMPAFDKAHIGIDKCEPKPQIVILDASTAATEIKARQTNR